VGRVRAEHLAPRVHQPAGVHQHAEVPSRAGILCHLRTTVKPRLTQLALRFKLWGARMALDEPGAKKDHVASTLMQALRREDLTTLQCSLSMEH